MKVAEYFSWMLSIFAIIGIGWKANEELQKIRRELTQNTSVTKEAKNVAEVSSVDLKNNLDQQFVRLQKFNAGRYRELALTQNEQIIQIAFLHEKIKHLEEKIDAITRNNQP